MATQQYTGSSHDLVLRLWLNQRRQQVRCFEVFLRHGKLFARAQGPAPSISGNHVKAPKISNGIV